MKSLLRTSSLVVALGVTLLVLSPAIVSAQTVPKDVPKTKSSPQPKLVANLLPSAPPLGSFAGEIDSSTVNVVSRKKKDPKQLEETIVELDHFSIWSTLSLNWNDNRVKQETAIRKYLEKLGLYDVSVKLANAIVKPKLLDPAIKKGIYLNVNPATKTFSLKYTVPGHNMFARLSVPWWFDPELKGKFDLEVVMNFHTKGPANNPLVLVSSQVFVRDFSHGVLNINIAGQGDLFAKASFADVGTAKNATTTINGLLSLYTAQTGFGIVTPGTQSLSPPRLVFELSQLSLILKTK